MPSPIDRRPVLIHIGFHKTGTTSLQTDFFVPESGFVSPWTGETVEHFIITHRERFDPRVTNDDFWNAVHARDPGNSLIPVISNEALCRPAIQCDAADRIAETFPEAKILIGVREQTDSIRSFYSEYITRGGTLPPHEFIGKTSDYQPGFEPPLPLERMEYHLLVRRYVRLFGLDRVKIICFENIKTNSIAYQNDIHDFAESGIRASVSLPRRRAGHRDFTLELRRRLNFWIQRRVNSQGDYNKTGLPFRALNRLCRFIDRHAPARLDRKWRIQLLRAIESHAGQDYFVQCNQELQRFTSVDLACLGYQTSAKDLGVA